MTACSLKKEIPCQALPSWLTVGFNSDNIRQHSLILSEGEKLMLNEIETQVINISPAAAEAVQNILTERNLEGYALRVYVSGGGCCGAQFGMALDNNFRDVDSTFDTNGIKLVVDEASMDYLRGASIDFINDPVKGTGFVVSNPNAKQGHGEGGCGGGDCGGSCSCNN
jgi:iron-sulfur cluster assembly accessory protein